MDKLIWKESGDANVYTILQDKKWFAEIRLNGEMDDEDQEVILNYICLELNENLNYLIKKKS